MKYFMISKSTEGGLTLETFEAEDVKAALLHVVDAWNGFTQDEDYQKCKNMSFKEIGEYLADMNVSDKIIDLALFSEVDLSEFGKDYPLRPSWSIFDYVDARNVF